MRIPWTIMSRAEWAHIETVLRPSHVKRVKGALAGRVIPIGPIVLLRRLVADELRWDVSRRKGVQQLRAGRNPGRHMLYQMNAEVRTQIREETDGT